MGTGAPESPWMSERHRTIGFVIKTVRIQAGCVGEEEDEMSLSSVKVMAVAEAIDGNGDLAGASAALLDEIREAGLLDTRPRDDIQHLDGGLTIYWASLLLTINNQEVKLRIRTNELADMILAGCGEETLQALIETLCDQ